MKPASFEEVESTFTLVTNHLNDCGDGVPFAVDPKLLYRILALTCIAVNTLSYIEDGFVLEDALTKSTNDYKSSTGGEA